MVCACVDIGTNTTRVLVADVKDGRLTEVLQQRVFTRIGTGPLIAPEKIAEVARVVGGQVELARLAGARGVRIVATAAGGGIGTTSAWRSGSTTWPPPNTSDPAR